MGYKLPHLIENYVPNLACKTLASAPAAVASVTASGAPISDLHRFQILHQPNHLLPAHSQHLFSTSSPILQECSNKYIFVSQEQQQLQSISLRSVVESEKFR